MSLNQTASFWFSQAESHLQQQGFVVIEVLVVTGLLITALVLAGILSIEVHEFRKRRRRRLAVAKVAAEDRRRFAEKP